MAHLIKSTYPVGASYWIFDSGASCSIILGKFYSKTYTSTSGISEEIGPEAQIGGYGKVMFQVRVGDEIFRHGLQYAACISQFDISSLSGSKMDLTVFTTTFARGRVKTQKGRILLN